MFERFTERARQVVVLAHEEARTLKHAYIGTEHLLLGLLGEQEGFAASVLENLDVTLEQVRAEVVRTVGPGEEVRSGQIPFTLGAKKVFEMALRESLSLGHNYIGTEHILLAIVRENDGVAIDILRSFDLDSEKIRNEVLRMLSGPGGRRHGPSKGGSLDLDRSWLDFTPAAAFDLVMRLAPLSGNIMLEVRHHGDLEPTFRVSCRLAASHDVLREVVALEAVGIRAILDADGTVRLGHQTAAASSCETQSRATDMPETQPPDRPDADESPGDTS